MSQELKDAIDAAIDARLIEHGLLEAEAPPAAKKGTTKAKAKPAADPVGDDEVTAESLKETLSTLVEKCGKPKLKELFGKFKVAKLGELKEAQYDKADKLAKQWIAEVEEDGDGDGDDDLFGD